MKKNITKSNNVIYSVTGFSLSTFSLSFPTTYTPLELMASACLIEVTSTEP